MASLTGPRLLLILAVVLFSLLAISQTSESSCVTQPISRKELNAAIAQPATPFAENVIQDQQLTVDNDIPRKVEEVLGQVVACANAGEPLRVWSLYSDLYLSRLFQIHGPFTDEQYQSYARPQPSGPGEGMQLERIESMRQSQDGLVVAQVVTSYPSVPMPKRLLFRFVVEGDRVEIEEVTGEISFSLP